VKAAFSSVQLGLFWLQSSYAPRAWEYTQQLRQKAYPIALAQLKRLWRAGICHGDIAWRNIAISDTGEVILLDLGLSCMVTDAARSEDLSSLEQLFLCS
jgi:tRNA A-37 threonylcarbamoyl transferase component Bud32